MARGVSARTMRIARPPSAWRPILRRSRSPLQEPGSRGVILARHLGQAMLLLLLYPIMLLSGAFTPPESMGPFMRYASLLSPVRHYVDFGYQVLFKENGLAYVWPDVAGILVLGMVLFAVSIRRFARLAR